MRKVELEEEVDLPHQTLRNMREEGVFITHSLQKVR
jgi:hypothetical protein